MKTAHPELVWFIWVGVFIYLWPCLLYTSSCTPTHLHLCSYNAESICMQDGKDIDSLIPYLNKNAINWIQIHGFQNTEVIQHVCQNFNVDFLTIQDILNSNHQTKIEQHDTYLSLIHIYGRKVMNWWLAYVHFFLFRLAWEPLRFRKGCNIQCFFSKELLQWQRPYYRILLMQTNAFSDYYLMSFFIFTTL